MQGTTGWTLKAVAEYAGYLVGIGVPLLVLYRFGWRIAEWVVFTVLDTDGHRKDPKGRAPIMQIVRKDAESRTMDSEAQAAALSALGNQVASVAASQRATADALTSLGDLPRVTQRMDTTLGHLGDVLTDLRNDLRAQRDAFTDHRQEQAEFNGSARAQWAGANERMEDLRERVNAWEGPERRSTSRSTRRHPDSRHAGRRDADHDPQYDPHAPPTDGD